MCKFIQSIVSFLSDNEKELIGILGTLSGTILGWVLKIIQDNYGKTEFIISDFKDEKSNNGEYRFSFSIFICNHSLKPKYINGFELYFYNKNKLSFFKPHKDNISYYLYDKKEKNVLNIINLEYNKPYQTSIESLLKKEDVEKIRTANKIKLKYYTEKGTSKKIKIKEKLCIQNAKIYSDGNGFPTK